MALGNLAARFVVALVALPPLLFAIYMKSPHYVWGVVFAASLIAMHEYLNMSIEDETDKRVSLGIGGVCCALLYWLPVWKPHIDPTLLVMILAFVPTALYYLFRFGDMQTVANRLNASVMAIVYGGIMFTFLALLKLRFGTQGGDIIVLILLTAWLSDTGGYFAGKYLGKAKLYEAVSPKKTWAGSIGGIASVLIGTAIFKSLRSIPDISWLDLILLCGPGAVLGQLGDLCESMVKRSRGVKDSGAILPGHGGILDRVDAILFIAPYFYVYLFLSRAYF
jgi:phosphatidate cytidylyltransferase